MHSIDFRTQNSKVYDDSYNPLNCALCDCTVYVQVYVYESSVDSTPLIIDMNYEY